MFPGATLILAVIALVVPAFFVLMWLVGGYNRLVALRDRYKQAYGQIDAHLKRRYDLLANVVETAKGYISQERGALEAVTAARNAASDANLRAAQAPGDPMLMKELSSAETALAGTFGRLLTVAEAFPDLKTDKTMMGLLEELTSVENKLESARQAYNDAVMRYNAVRMTFPTHMVAVPFGFFGAGSFAPGN